MREKERDEREREREVFGVSHWRERDKMIDIGIRVSDIDRERERHIER